MPVAPALRPGAAGAAAAAGSPRRAPAPAARGGGAAAAAAPRPRRRACAPAAAAAALDAGAEAATAAALEALLGAGTAPTRRLGAAEVLDALRARQHAAQRSTFHAFYSSELGGVVTDPALMVVQADDHALHRGHAVFDSALLIGGFLYDLEGHVDRLLLNAARTGIAPPPRLGRAQILRTLLETAAASRRRDGHMRFFLSAGRGGFGLSPAECVASSFYAVVYSKDPTNDPAAPDSEAHLHGWAVKSSPVPPKAPFFAGVKSVGYLPNALAQADAEAEGLETGVFVDADGYVLEGANANVAALLPDGTLAFVLPPAERGALAGRTAARAMELAAAAAGTGALDGVARVEARRLTVAEARGAREVVLLSSSLPAMPVVRWDGGEIGDGAPGTAALGLRALLLGDRQPAPGGGRHWEVPYGCLTAMGA